MRDVNELLRVVMERGGSDLHITVGVPPMIRLNGRLMPIEGEPCLTPDMTREAVFSIMSQDRRAALEQNLEHDFAYSIPGEARFRVNAYFQRGSLGAAFRLIPVEIRTIADLGLPAVLEDLAMKPRGFVLVTGPTGCGKSTTLAAMIDHINHNREQHIITIEDPIEYLHVHDRSVINQREVGSDTQSFARALKHILRQDPDVILIGEMRDLETVSAALTAAETGHLVFATLHTQDAVQTVDRIIDVFPPHQQQQVRVQLSGVLQGVVSQQLLPTIDGRGRVVACEVLIPTPAVRNLIREAKTHMIQTAMQTGTSHGMVTMDHALADMYRRGMITLETAMQRAVDQNDLKSLLSQTGG
ncbi:MAG: type IV pilus twitching motility protein PilT [Actinomycetota bacterium]|nr:type IV pilus twitching motility protein PilT [Actinomycetota bacterium]